MLRFLMLLSVLAAGQAAFAQSAAPIDWVLTDVDGAPAAYSATLTIEGNRLSGKAPCNRYAGEMLGTPPNISFGPMIATRMACDALDAEGAYLEALAATTKIEEANGSLTLTGLSHVLVYGLSVK